MLIASLAGVQAPTTTPKSFFLSHNTYSMHSCCTAFNFSPHVLNGRFAQARAPECNAHFGPLQETRSVAAPKRASCLIIGRHPQVPPQVRVICKQLTGRLQLGECCQHLNIIASGNELMSPSEFEAAAGCSKGKNWKVRLQKLLCFGPTLPSPSLRCPLYVARLSLPCVLRICSPLPFLPHPTLHICQPVLN